MKFLLVASLLMGGALEARPEPEFVGIDTVGPVRAASINPIIKNIEAALVGNYALFFKSNGGDGEVMFNLIRTMELAQVRGVNFVCVVEHAYSAAVAIFSVCNVRAALPRALFMMHPVSSSVSGNADKMREYADEMEAYSDSYLRQIGRVLNIPFAVLKRRAGNREYWLDAGRAQEIGLVEVILP